MKKRKNTLLALMILLSLVVTSAFAGEIEFIIDEEQLDILPGEGPIETMAPVKENQAEDNHVDFDEGQNANQAQAALSVSGQSYEETHPIPAKDSPYPFKEGEISYWNTPMDISQPELLWKAMQQPITVLKGDEKKQYQLRAQPSKDADIVGDVTYESQSVRVIETLDNGWTLVESYSSSFHYSEVKAWGKFVHGYVETKLLKEKPPVGDYGIIIDKMTQRMYIIKEGELFTTMIISTGLATTQRPYQETRSGEYLIVSAVGAFKSDDQRETYELALRYNAGDLIHKTPYILRGETKNFTEGEKLLGDRASHGCIRVQRKRTPEGVNQDWLWKNRKMGTRVWIWEDYQGRQIDSPDENLTLYYNPNGGENYHSQSECHGVRDEYLPLTALQYGDLDNEKYADLTPCEYCNPPMRPEVIAQVNQQYAAQ